MAEDRTTTTGERQGVRESIDRLTRQAVENGAEPKWAERKAREAALRWDKKKDGGR